MPNVNNEIIPPMNGSPVSNGPIIEYNKFPNNSWIPNRMIRINEASKISGNKRGSFNRVGPYVDT